MSFLTNKALENLLSYSSLKGKVISENIANIGSKNYQRKDVQFKNILDETIQSGMKATNSKHMNGAGGMASDNNFEIIPDKNDELVSGINNVDIDREMSELAENTLRFKFASKKMGAYYKNLQNVIKGD